MYLDFPSIVFIVIFIIFIVIKKLIKTTILIAVILLILSSVFLLLAYNDMRDLQENYAESTNMVLFEQTGEIVSGISVKGLSFSKLTPIPESQLDIINSNHKSGNYNALLMSNYKVFIVKETVFPDLDPDNFFKEFDQKISQQGPEFVFDQIKQGNIIIIPETPFFFGMKHFPALIPMVFTPND